MELNTGRGNVGEKGIAGKGIALKRIIHWGKYYPPDMGGIESVTQVLAEGQGAGGFQVEVFCFTAGKAEMQDRHGVRVHRCPQGLFMASQPFGLQYVNAGLREGRAADVVHLHAPNLLASLMSLALGRRPKLVVHWHSDIVGKGWLGRLVRPVERLMLRRADAIICTSPTYAEASQPLADFRAKVRVIPIGIPGPGGQNPPAALPMEWETFLGSRQLILAVGRLVPYKGFRHLVAAASALPESSVVVIAGEGPLRGELEAQIREAGMEGRIRMAGRVPPDVLEGLFTRAALFCLPSVERSEAFGVVLLEAMSRGLPLVATTIPGSGVSWVNSHGETGFNVPVADPMALADACAAIAVDHPLRERFSAGSKRRFAAMFTNAAFVEAVAKCYQEIEVPWGGV